MSMSNFLSYLQQLLSMIDPENRYSVALAQTALKATVELAMASEKASSRTIRAMMLAQYQFQYLASHQSEFAGVPGEYEENEKKRRRLGMLLQPGC